MRAPSPSFWVGVFSTFGVLYLALRDIERTSPGELATVHERESDLAARSGCTLCHGGGDVTLTQACLECHEDIAVQMDGGAGLHGSLEENVVVACAMCHSDHHGTGFAIVNERSFAIAGIRDVNEFDHETIGFVMEGKHTELACTECHEFAEEVVLPEGGRRFIGLDQDCATCHEDPHEGRMASACADCHSQVAFDDLSPFVHDERFMLEGSHSAPGCLDCHPSSAEHSIEAVGGKAPVPEWRECRDCHESPHRNEFLAGVAQLVESTPGGSCAECHPVVHESFRVADMEISPRQHAATGFPLDDPHSGLACSDCHTPELDEFAERYPGRPRDECRHCHEDAHRGFFATFADVEPLRCTTCHLETSFTGINDQGFDHARWTGFELLGAHAQESCESCHPRAASADDLGRSFGRVAEHFGTVESCASCHADPHDGQFDLPDLPALVDDRSGCARCHSQTSFRSLEAEFEHDAWTGFELSGAHGRLACSDCHTSLPQPDDTGRHWARAAGGACADCHEDPHVGQFELEDVTDCQRCHSSTETFTRLSFNHNWDSRFPLDRTHAAVSCSECHRPWVVGGVEVVRYRPLGMECVDCHGVNQDQLRSKRKGKR